MVNEDREREREREGAGKGSGWLLPGDPKGTDNFDKGTKLATDEQRSKAMWS